MDQLQSFNRLLQVIKKNERHPYYKETVALAKDYRAYSTGEGLSEKLRKFASRESEEAFTERKNITIHITKSIISNLTHIYYRIPRSNGVKTDWEAKTEQVERDFKNIMRGYSRHGATKYLEERLKDLIELDPNAWLITETTGTDGRDYAQPYAYEVYSENAIMYEYDISKLLYLVDWRTVKVVDKLGATRETDQYTIYTEVGAVKVVKWPDRVSGPDLKNTGEVDEIPEAFNIDMDSYIVDVPLPYDVEEVPAVCVGYLADKKNNGKTYVNMYDACVPFLEKMLKANSEMDISMAKHAHAQKIQYVRRCNKDGCYEGEDGKYYIDYIPEGEQDYVKKLCPNCSGKGYIDVTTGGLEYIFLPMPTSKDEMLDLDNIVHYVSVDVETPKWQFDYIQQMIRLCEKIIFNQDDISSEDVAKTAREIMVNEYNKDDTLRPYAVNYAHMYDFILSTCAEMTQLEIEITAFVSKDFNMRGLAEWTTILGGLTAAGANDSIIASVQYEIMQCLYGDTYQAKEYDVEQALIPFQNFSKDYKALILADLDRADKYRIAAIYGYDIIKQLVGKYPLFYEFNYTRQKELFDEQVLLRVAEITPEPQRLPNFTE